MLARDTHSALLQIFVNFGRKKISKGHAIIINEGDRVSKVATVSLSPGK